MNWADAVIAVIVGLSLLIGVLRGFTRELLGTIAWVLAFWVGFHFYEDAAFALAEHIETPLVRKAAAFAGLFLLTLVVASLGAFFAARAVREGHLAGVDRTLGGGFGFLRGLFIVAALLMVAGLTSARDDAWWQGSFLVRNLEWTADALRSVTPKSWLERIEREDDSPGAVRPALPERKPAPTPASPAQPQPKRPPPGRS